jgi:hypothetical protein
MSSEVQERETLLQRCIKLHRSDKETGQDSKSEI